MPGRVRYFAPKSKRPAPPSKNSIKSYSGNCLRQAPTPRGKTMTLSSDVVERLPHVEGSLNYLAPMAEKPMNLAYDPPPGVPRSNGIPEPHVMAIHDARAVM